MIKDPRSEFTVAALLKAAPPRPMPSSDARLRAQAAARARWQQLLRRRRRVAPRLTWVTAAAAAIAALVIGVLQWPGGGSPVPSAAFGEFVRVDGPLRRAPPGLLAVSLAPGVMLPVGAEFGTDGARVAIALPSGASLRLDRDTRLRIDRADRVSLMAGSLYFDSGPAAGSDRLRVALPVGVVEHIGTQYQVTVQPDRMVIAVREGTLRLRAPGQGDEPATIISHGQRLHLRAGAAPAWSSVSPFDRSWAWAAETAPVLDIEGRSVRAYLDWTCREHGWTWQIEHGVSPFELEHVRLHGSIEGLSVSEALALVAAIADLQIALDAANGTVTVSPGRSMP